MESSSKQKVYSQQDNTICIPNERSLTMNNLSENSVKTFTINGEPLTNIAQLKQVLANLTGQHTASCEQTEYVADQKRCQEAPLGEERDYARLGTEFIERLSQIANGSDHPDTHHSDAQRLTCAADNFTLEIQYFPDGTALIGWVDTSYGLIYLYHNDKRDRCAASHPASDQRQDGQPQDICLGKELLCRNKETLQDILLYFYETAEQNPNYRWIEDFSYTGSGGWHQDWMKKSLKRRTIPEEQDEALKKRRKAQENGEWQWGTPWQRKDYWRGAVCWENPEQMAQLEQLTYLEAADSASSQELSSIDARSTPVSPENTVQAPDSVSSVQREHEILMRQTASRLMKEKEFTQRGSGIRDLCFLRNCGHLRRLDLRRNDVEDLSPIASLHQLKELTLDYNLISDLSPLEGLEQLRQLWLMGNKVRSLEPLRGLHNLNSLHLRGNPLASGTLAALRKCKRLGSLDLSHTGIQDISDLEYCRAWSLDLYGNPGLTGLEVIATMKNLSCLDLDWETARRYDITALVPRLTEHARYGDHVQYVWPKKYFDE